MKLHDLSIRKKLILSNFMMILIPVLTIIAIMGGIILAFFSLTRTGGRVGLLMETKGTISNYQLQLTFDSICRDINSPKDSKDLLNSCAQLEQAGAQISISTGSDMIYLTKGINSDELNASARGITGGRISGPLFYRSGDGLVYQTEVQDKAKKSIEVLIVAKKLAYGSNQSDFLSVLERYIKLGTVSVGGFAVIIILLTGIVLAEILSKKIVIPLNKLRRAANEIQNGSLDERIDFTSKDELGQVCEDFDKMRLRLKESVRLQQKYEDGRKEMIAGISHDLATPLTSIKGYVSGLMDGIANTPEKQAHYLRTIYDTACNMDQLVDSLFLFSKLDLGRIPFNMEAVNLVSYFEDYCTEMQSQLNRLEMRISFVNHGGEAVRVNLDRVQFNRVLSNLMDNSVKYKKDGWGSIEIALSGRGGSAEIQFSDNGRGVEDSEADKIFDSFYRTDVARTNVAKGSGLGLAITKQIVEQMGGTINAKGNLNEGLTVNIVLPKCHEEK